MWMKFQKILQVCSSHGMTSKTLLECYYKGFGPEKRSMDDQICERDVIRQPYDVVAKILDDMVEVDKEARKNQEWNALVTL